METDEKVDEEAKLIAFEEAQKNTHVEGGTHGGGKNSTNHFGPSKTRADALFCVAVGAVQD